MAKRVRKLTAKSLKRMIQQEARKIRIESSDPIAAGVEDPEKVSAEEVEAGDLAGSLEKDIDYIRALKIHETELRTKLKKIEEAKNKLSKRIAEKI